MTLYLVKGKASREGLIPVKRMVSRKGKPFMQTFYVRPDQVPKKQDFIHHTDMIALPAPEKKGFGPKGDDRVYILRDAEGEFDENGKVKKEAVRIPEKAIVERFEMFGRNFVLHHTIETDNTIYQDRFTVTETTTGNSVVRTPDGREGASALLERAKDTININKDRLEGVLEKAPKVNDTFRTIEDIGDFKMPQPITDDDIRRVSEHIINVIKDRENDDDDEKESLRLDVRDWIRKNITTDADADEFIEEFYEKHWYEMEIAIAGDMDIEEAQSTVGALAYLDQNADTGYGNVDIDSIREWWDAQGNPILSESDVQSLYDSNEWGEVEEGYAITTMIINKMSIEETEAWIQKTLDDYERELGTPNIEYFSMTDRNGTEWEGNDLVAIGQWVAGDMVKASRSEVKARDEKRRGGVTDIATWNDVGRIVEEKMIMAEYDVLYRGTSNNAWKALEVGDRMSLGMASFSNRLGSAEIFAGMGNTVIILQNNKTTETEPVKGIDIDHLIEDVDKEDYGVREASGIGAHETENEFIVRAPSIEITKIETAGDYHMVYAKVAEMSLLKAMQDIFSDRAAILAAAESIFDDPLHRKAKNEADTES